MLCALGDFTFESQGVNLANIKRQSTFNFANNTLINDFDDWQATGRFQQIITVSGKLIQYDNSALDSLHLVAEKKEPVTLAFADGRASSVLIQEINTDAADFLKNGKFLKQDFEISLVVIHGNV